MSLVEQAKAVRERVARRLAELEPLVREYEELQRVAAEMGIEADEHAAAAAAAAAATASKPGSGPGSGPASKKPRAKRSSGGAAGARKLPSSEAEAAEIAARVTAAVAADPGKSVVDYAAALDLAPTSLYRPVRELTAAGQLVKRSRQLYPPESSEN